MIKATGRDTRTGRKLLVLGLSFDNLDKFRAEPLKTRIRIDGEELGLAFDVLIFSCETEADGAELMGAPAIDRPPRLQQ